MYLLYMSTVEYQGGTPPVIINDWSLFRMGHGRLKDPVAQQLRESIWRKLGSNKKQNNGSSYFFVWGKQTGHFVKVGVRWALRPWTGNGQLVERPYGIHVTRENPFGHWVEAVVTRPGWKLVRIDQYDRPLRIDHQEATLR